MELIIETTSSRQKGNTSQQVLRNLVYADKTTTQRGKFREKTL